MNRIVEVFQCIASADFYFFLLLFHFIDWTTEWSVTLRSSMYVPFCHIVPRVKDLGHKNIFLFRSIRGYDSVENHLRRGVGVGVGGWEGPRFHDEFRNILPYRHTIFHSVTIVVKQHFIVILVCFVD